MVTGIKETEDVIAVGQAIVTAIQKSLADGKFGILDGRFFIPVVGAVQEAVAGASLIKVELKDLTAEETTRLLTECVDLIQGLAQAIEPVFKAS